MNLSAASWDASDLLPKEAAGYRILVRKDFDGERAWVAQLVVPSTGLVVAWTGGGTVVAGYRLDKSPWWDKVKVAMAAACNRLARSGAVLREVAEGEAPPDYEAPIGVAGWQPTVVGSAP